MKYCRYCSYCILGDCYYCTCHDKVLKRVDKPTSCEDFVESDLGDVETGKKYTPRAKDSSNQITMQFDGESASDEEKSGDETCAGCQHLGWFGDYSLHYCDITKEQVETDTECRHPEHRKKQ